MERTLVLVKPDGIKRKLLGEIISMYEKKGLEIVEMKMVKPNLQTAERHYEEHKGREYFNSLLSYITEGRICAIVVEGENVIKIVRKLNGDKDPLKVDMGSIRGRFGCDKTKNLVHASDSLENSNREIKIWFAEL